MSRLKTPISVLWCGVLTVALCGFACPYSRAQAPQEKTEDLVGSRWDGTITWGEKRNTRNRTVFLPYSMKISFRFEADGNCSKGQAQPCKWERDGNNVKITWERTKKACPASASLVVKDKAMAGTWDHYGGFSCYLIPPQRQIKLTRHG